MTGTVFEGHRISVEGWFEFLLGLMSYESLANIARRDRRSPTTPPYQLAKVFMVLDGVQDGVVLSGRVQADEMMYKVPAADRDPALRGRRAGGYSREIKRLPDRDNPLWKVNRRLCFLLRLFLDGHSGFDRSDFGGWLDLFSVVMNPPEDRIEKVAMVLDRAMSSPNTLRYRDYYKQNGSSEG